MTSTTEGVGAELLKAGPLCTVQDLGRRTGRRQGISPGGAMDMYACLWANRLLGNDPNEALLEITLGGAKLRFARDATIALTGAECAVDVDGQHVQNWRTLRVRVGQTLSYGYSSRGMRAYLAFPGGLRAPRLFGSASVVLREGVDATAAGVPVGPLAEGAELRWHGAPTGRAQPVGMRSVPLTLIPAPSEPLMLPLITGYEWLQFSTEDREAVWASEWAVEVASDRVATRLAGPKLVSGPTSLDSTPLVDGTVQVPGSGAPLVFMRDRPTVGGYPKLGSVDPEALDRLAQARPGTRVKFVSADAGHVLARLVERRAFFGLGIT